MNCLVTGATGFIGSHLMEYLSGQGLAVHGLDKEAGGFPGNLARDAHLISCNILDRNAVQVVINSIRPDYVFHLAAQSLPKVSWEHPDETIEINVLGSIYLLDAIRAARIDPLIEMFCSSGEYALRQDARPIPEDTPLEPSSPYALSKIAQDHLSVLYGKAYRMRIVRVRPFFIIGPRKTGDVSSDVARRVVAIEHGLAKELKVGNLDSVRDFLDVRDAVKAFHVALERGVPGEVYNICSGEGHSVRELVEQLCNLARTPVALREDPGLYRNLDEPARIGDNRKLTALGWKPGVDFPGALAAVLDFWRNNPDP